MGALNRRDLLRISAAGALSAVAAAQAALKGGDKTAPASGPAAKPSIRARMFWTWDHSTEWALNRPGAQTYGAANTYTRGNDLFLQDYTNLLHWCGRHGIDAVVVWGLLRDCHGGLQSAKRLCEVAARENVRLLCGAGLNSYGGVYYEGDSPYSLERHLQAHGELYALNAAGGKLPHHACPSRRENQQFAAESLGWLFKNLPLGGVQVETGDCGVCQCKLCRERRKHPAGAFSWEDMALMYPVAAGAIRAASPDAWVVCETYSNPEPQHGPEKAPGFGDSRPAWSGEALAQFPAGAFVQWVGDMAARPWFPWTAAGAFPGGRQHHVLRAHFSTYWGRFRGELAIDWIADMVQRSIAHGFDAISLFGEVSPFHAGAELNYLALGHCGSAANPTADLDLFLREVAGPLLGGADQARDYLRFARLLDDRARIPDALKSISARCATLPPDAARRWIWLANYLASFIYPEPPT
jgi:hypothetical protein